eukprot:scaffold275517_cov17-Tisochrysis_lutea.AAC.1
MTSGWGTVSQKFWMVLYVSPGQLSYDFPTAALCQSRYVCTSKIMCSCVLSMVVCADINWPRVLALLLRAQRLICLNAQQHFLQVYLIVFALARSLQVYTSDIRGAGTDARVYITFFNDKGMASRKFNLDSSANNFERGMVRLI